MKYFVTIIFISLLIFGCSRGTFPERVDFGSVVVTESDGPVFIISGYGTLQDDENPVIKAGLQLFRTNLVFRTDQEDEYSANVNIRYEIFRLESNEVSERIKSVSERKRISGQPDDVLINHTSEKWSRIFEVQPGLYRLVISVTDQASNKTIARNKTVFVPGGAPAFNGISDISLFGISNSTTDKTHLSTYDVPESYDYLRFSFHTNFELDSGEYAVHMRIVEFEADNEPARRLTDPNLPSSSLKNRGIHYGISTVVKGSEYSDTVQNGLNHHEYIFEITKRSNYRFEVFITDKGRPSHKNAHNFSARDFAVRSENFPLIGTPFEMAEPLAYIMTNRQYRELMSIQNPDSLLTAVETFWVTNIGSKEKAREVMAMYYNKVVSANLQFSNFKEGWKTDMGMVFILFGQPWNIDYSTQNIRWTYGYDRRDSDFNFIFVRTRKGDPRFPFDNWVVRRSTNFHTVTYRRVQDWLSGYVLGRRHPY